ncbi:MAG: hypothetical protein ACREGE_00730 [Candidatus Microsaccharimonas sp.]
MSSENPNFLNELLETEVRAVRLNRLRRTLAASTITFTCFSAGFMALSSENDSNDSTIDVAIVPFEMDVEDASELGETIESSFNDVANGALVIDVTIVEPSAATIGRYQEINKDSCIDKNDLLNYGSYIASTGMSELNEYNKVLALNADPACQDTVGGVAQLQGRYGEVFNAASSWDIIVNNGGATVQEKSDNGNATTTTYLHSPVGTGVHEMLHLFGLGHNGILTPPKDRAEGEVYSMRIYSDTPRDVTIDVREFVEKQTYDEYGSVEVMGKGILDLTEGLTVLERHVLDTIYEPRVGSLAIEAHSLSDKPLVLSGAEPMEIVITHRLKAPIELQNKEETKMMTSLIFVPKETGEHPHTIQGLTVYLLSDDNNSAEIGELTNLGESETTYTLQLDTETIVVHLDYVNARTTLALQAKN